MSGLLRHACFGIRPCLPGRCRIRSLTMCCGRWTYFENEEVQLLNLPYKSTGHGIDYTATIILPRATADATTAVRAENLPVVVGQLFQRVCVGRTMRAMQR